MKKKLVVTVCAVLMCASLVFALVACDPGAGNGNNNTPGTSDPGTSDTDGTTTPLSTTELIAFSAATSANVLASIAPTSSVAAESVSGNTAEKTVTDDEQVLVDKINAQIRLIENFVNDKPVRVTESVSDKPEYAKMLTITATSLSGETVTYVMYFNETLEAEEPDDDDFDLDNEQEFTLNGIMVLGDKQYSLRGEKELEDGEYELSLTASVDRNNYVVFEQEIENDEQEFKYKVFENGIKVKDFALEIETERGEQSVKVKDGAAGGTYLRYFRKTENGKSFIKADFTENGVKNSVKVFPYKNTATGETGYRYVLKSGNETIVINNNGSANSGQNKTAPTQI